jgi:hypothetical protein
MAKKHTRHLTPARAKDSEYLHDPEIPPEPKKRIERQKLNVDGASSRK